MPIDYEKAVQLKTRGRRFTYGQRETMLYALGLGFGADPLDVKQLRFVYEKDLRVVPTMATIVAWGSDALEETGIDFTKLVQGEQRLTVHNPLPPSGEIVADWDVREIVDKGPGKGALVIHEYTLRDGATGTLLATLGRTSFARGDGGFGGPTQGGPQPHEVPEREPDRSIDLPIPPGLALIYRLSGDLNPLHADPAVAAKAGFDRPILHGLATYGIACRGILEAWTDLDPAPLRQFDVRFSSPVFPGDTMRLRMWRNDNVVSFEGVVPERGATVLKNGRAVLSD
jgi:acyl dehydratase